MQNAHIHLDINKALSPAILFGGIARRWVSASAPKSANYQQGSPPPPHFTNHKYYTSQGSSDDSFCRSVSVMPARRLSTASPAFFIIASGSTDVS